jgi:chitinase
MSAALCMAWCGEETQAGTQPDVQLSESTLTVNIDAPSPRTAKAERVVLAYVISWSNEIPDPEHVTHINYALGQIKNNGGKWNSVNMGSGIAANNPNRLKQIVALKKQKPSLKVLLSIGGWGCDGFSQMSANDEWRADFARDCKRVVDEFGLDGIDLDWESPTIDAQGQIACSPDDTKNFTLLVKEIRAQIGKDKLLTIATGSSGEHYDWAAIDPYMDFYNIMSYDMGNPPNHQSALYKFGDGGWGWADNAVNQHLDRGVPAGKLTLGIPFYGRFSTELKSGDNFVPYRDIAAMIAKGEYSEKWDDTSKVPYLVDANGKMVCSYDNTRSVALKCRYALDRGMLGAMYWDYSQDDAQSTLRNAVYNGIMNAD